LFEKFCIQNYINYIDNTLEDYYVYYFHTKGVSRPPFNDDCIFVKIRKNLNYFTLKKYKISIKLLEKYDAVGCSLFRYPKPHFSGNFWWSKKSHIIKLNNKIGDGYLAPEMYICSYPDGKYVSLNNNTNNGEVNNLIYLTEHHILNNTTDIPINNESEIQYLNMC
jgi:hypothetical protein